MPPTSTRPRCTRSTIALWLALTLGCASSREAQREPPAEGFDPRALVAAAHASRALDEVLAAARATLGRDSPRLDGRAVPTDCSGYLRAIYLRAGVDLFSEAQPGDNGVRAIVRWVERHGRMHQRKVPAPGDLVFFDNSYDRNGDGRLNDRLTHAGLVEQVEPDGTALIIHATNHGIVREPMNLLRPHEDLDAGGRPINAPLRRKSSRDPASTPRRMSELFAGFGAVLPGEPRTAGL